MIRAIDLDELLRVRHARIELANGLERNELVLDAMNDELGLGRSCGDGEVVLVYRWRDADQGADSIVAGANGHRDVRAEREACRPQLEPRIPAGGEIDGGTVVILFAAAFVPGAGAAPNTTEVEAQDGAPDTGERLGTLEYDLRMHGAAFNRQRMPEDDYGARHPGRTVDQGLERTHCPGDFTNDFSQSFSYRVSRPARLPGRRPAAGSRLRGG